MKFLLSFISEKACGAGVCVVCICHQQVTFDLLASCSRNMNLEPCSKNHGGFLGLQIGMVVFHLTLMVKIQNAPNGSWEICFGKLVYVVIAIICDKRFFQVQPLFFHFFPLMQLCLFPYSVHSSSNKLYPTLDQILLLWNKLNNNSCTLMLAVLQNLMLFKNGTSGALH